MNVLVRKIDDIAVIEPEGAIDTRSAPDFEKAVLAFIVFEAGTINQSDRCITRNQSLRGESSIRSLIFGKRQAR